MLDSDPTETNKKLVEQTIDRFKIPCYVRDTKHFFPEEKYPL